MNRVPIAEIKLAPGEVGYYDDYSRIYLSEANNRAIVYSGVNCTQIKRSIKSGRLILVSGGFNAPVKQEEKVTDNKTVVAPEVIDQLEKQEVKVEEVEAPIEAKAEVAAEEPVKQEEPVTEEAKGEEECPVKEVAPVTKKAPAARRKKAVKNNEAAAE